jgi:type I restriction enzyme S subunit
MKRYEKYKSSGVEWIGEIPEHWYSLRIKRLTNVKRGASPRPIDDPKYFDDNGEFAWVRIADVTASERYLELTTQRLSELGSSLSVKRYPGDFLLSIAGTVGKPIITKIKCCIHDGFVWFPNLKTNPEYLYYIFSTGLPYQGLGKWGTQLNLNTDTVGDIFIPLPQKEETENIVGYLDNKTAQIDKLIANKQRLIELLKEERTAIINQAVTKGINPKVKLKPRGIEWLGDIPEHWEVKKLKYLASRIGDGIHSTPNYVNCSDIYFINGNNLSQGNIIITESTRSIDENEYEKLKIDFKIGTILLSINGTIGNLAVYKNERVVLGKSAAYIEFDGEMINNFAYYFLQSSFIKDYFETSLSGTTIKNLSLYTLRNTRMLVPPREEQAAVACHIETETQKADNTISKIEKEIELLQEYRTALISEVVTGKIKVI